MATPTRPFVSTSYIERQNLTIRMACRRFTRLTNAFSKKLDNLKAALAVHFTWYNFVRIHRSLRGDAGDGGRGDGSGVGLGGAARVNTLYYGDNLDVLRRYIKDDTIDLVYLDPPFKSDQNYNVLFAEQDGTRSAAQIKAFEAH